MYKFNVSTSIKLNVKFGRNALKLINLFGISMSRLKAKRLHQLKFEAHAGQIIFITGPSGAGKSILLNALYCQSPTDQRLRLSDIELETDKCVIDCMGLQDEDMLTSLESLNKAGLSDVFCMLQSPRLLSEGQQSRYRLARALSQKRNIIFADEFTSSMDRITACVLSFRLRKTADRSGKIFILASCHNDIINELRPDIVIIKHASGRTDVLYPNQKSGITKCNRPC